MCKRKEGRKVSLKSRIYTQQKIPAEVMASFIIAQHNPEHTVFPETKILCIATSYQNKDISSDRVGGNYNKAIIWSKGLYALFLIKQKQLA